MIDESEGPREADTDDGQKFGKNEGRAHSFSFRWAHIMPHVQYSQ